MISNNWQDKGALPINMQPDAGSDQPQPKKQRSFLQSFIPLATGVIGGAAGSFIAPGVGTAAGGAAGAALGEWLTQKLSGEADDGIDKGNIVEEGILGAFGGIGKGAKAVKGATTAVRAGEGASAAAKILRYGAPVAKTVAKEGAEATAKGGVRSFISKKLLGAADDTALRASQLSGKKEALKGFDKRFGEDLGTYLRKNNLIGKTGKDVEGTIIKDLNSKYGELVKGVKRPITSSDVLVQNQKALEKLLNSGSSANKKLADDVFEELANIFKKEGDSISPQRLNELKAEFQANARNAYKLGSNAKPGVDAKVAEYLKKALQGVSGSDELATTGKELDKAYKAADLLASAEQNGRGTLSLGLTDLMAAGGGGIVGGGLPGAAAAVAGKRAINSPKVQSFIANKLAQTGEQIATRGAGKAAKVVAEPTVTNTVKSILKAQVPARGINSMVQGTMVPPELPVDPQMPMQNAGAFDATGSDIDQANLMQILSGGMTPNESQYSREAMMSDVQRDPKNAKEYMALYEMMNPEPAPLELSDSAITKTTDAQKALAGLDELDAILENGYAGGKIAGNVRKLNPLDDTFKTQQASIDRIRQIVGKALEGGVLRKEDELKYAKILPTMQDSETVYRNKVAQLRTMIGTDLEQYLSLQKQYGKGAGQVSGTDLTALMTVQ